MASLPDPASGGTIFHAAVLFIGITTITALPGCGDSGGQATGPAATDSPATAPSTPTLSVARTYSYYFVGNPEAPVGLAKKPATASFVLMGGGADVDSAFRWMIARAGVRPGTGGRFVILRASGTDAYDPYVYYSDAASGIAGPVANEWVGGASLGLSAVETLVIPNIAAANDPEVARIVERADAVFIAGGDQSDYIKYWKGTELDRALNRLMQNHIPIGGTSAGLAVLGQFDYSALFDSISAVEALQNPFDPNLTLDPDPLKPRGGFLAPPELASMIFDSHLDERDRMGRLIAFVARTVAPDSRGFGCPGGILDAASDSPTSARGIGMDVETALLVQGAVAGGTVTAKRVTNAFNTTTESAVYFVRPFVAPSLCAAGRPLTIRSVEVRKLADSDTVFDLSQWSGVPVLRFLDVDNGVLAPPAWR